MPFLVRSTFSGWVRSWPYFNVAVHDALLVQVGQRLADLIENPFGQGPREGPLLNGLEERPVVDILHRDGRAVPLLVVGRLHHPYDIRVVQLPLHLNFSQSVPVVNLGQALLTSLRATSSPVSRLLASLTVPKDPNPSVTGVSLGPRSKSYFPILSCIPTLLILIISAPQALFRHI